MSEGLVETDFLVIGSGIAGLTYALKAADAGRVLVVTKKNVAESNSSYAQGGIASVLGPGDSFQLHVQDTLSAGAGFCNEDVVKMVVESGPDRIRDLMDLGVAFSSRNGFYDLGREGGHSVKRVIHCKDRTGRDVAKALAGKVEKHDNIRVLEDYQAMDLLTVYPGSMENSEPVCVGATLFSLKSGLVLNVRASFTVLATGGAGMVYKHTSNPDIATGDGVAMAYRAGASIANMEFVQFHPTCLNIPGVDKFLISEAVRGEGGILEDEGGTAFMGFYDPMKDLACRDVVARSIDSRLKERGEQSVFLNVTHLDPDFLKSRFPTIYSTCKQHGIHMTRDRIPVVPAAHYMCGGVRTDKMGRSDMVGLLAIGEAACTGLHGANRLASNSLLEALVFAHNAAEYCSGALERKPAIPSRVDHCSGEKVALAEHGDLMKSITLEVRELMWSHVGVVRSSEMLEKALERIRELKGKAGSTDFLSLSRETIELANLMAVAELITLSALKRLESRGLHFCSDYPARDDENYLKDTILKSSGGAAKIMAS